MKRTTAKLGGVSVVALLAAGVFGIGDAAACTATAQDTVAGLNHTTNSVTVNCGPADNRRNFDTGFAAFNDISDTYQQYNGQGNDTFNMTGGTLSGSAANLPPRLTNPVATNAYLNAQTTFVSMGAGDDTVNFSGGTLNGDLRLGDGNDTATFTGGTVNGSVIGDDTAAGNDSVFVRGTAVINGSVFTGDGNDAVTVGGGQITGDAAGNAVDLGLGNDTFDMTAGAVTGAVLGGGGDDGITISGGTITGNVQGGAGVDVVTVNGGTITGGIDSETVRLRGGSIGGDITGISATTLDIQSGTNLTLRNGVLFQGLNAVGVIASSNLARSAGNGAFQSQVFNGFNTLTANASQIGFTANQSIAQLFLNNGSTLFTVGQVNLGGGLTVNNSTVSLINGIATDRFVVSSLSLNTATIGIDVNQGTAQADQIVTTGTFNATGANVVLVNLIGTPQFGAVTIIPIAPVAGEAAPTAGVGSPLFTVAGVPQTLGGLFAFDVITGPNGGLYLRSIAGNPALALATRVAVDSQAIETVTATMLDISNDAIQTALGLAISANRADGAPAFGIYASGQLAHVNHDGFDFSGPGFSGTGPSFGANDFSVAGSVELDAAKYWGFDNQYGLNLGLFGGFASTDVTLDSSGLFNSVGNAKNESGMVGGYGLFRTGTTYALIAATGFFGQTDLYNGVLNSTGDYGTAGVAVTGSAGHIFVLGEHLRFDLRGGLLGAGFEGDPYTDSIGVAFGHSRISFGAIKFEPGIYGDYKLENGMTVSPYARMELQQRFGYSNTSTIQTVKVNFKDADFSASFSGGVNVQVTKSTTLSGEVRTKFSADSNTVAGKVGVKVKF